MARHYPPLNALLVFLTAARSLSFTVAAEELFVTRSAVSRQIKGLEDHLGIKLFNRLGTGLELTESGLLYSNKLSLIFADIKSATNLITGNRDENTFKLGISATFNSTWLMSRLNGFYDLHPSVAIAFLTNSVDMGTESVDFSNDSMDAAIRLGTGDWPSCQVDKLIDIHVQPVCAPGLMAKPVADNRVEDLAKYNWLGYAHLPNLWQDWLQDAGCGEMCTAKKEIELDNVAVAVQAAVDGLGIIPMYRPLADPLLASGQLVLAHEHIMLKPEAYYLVSPEGGNKHAPTDIFRQWVLAEAESFRQNWTPS